MRLCSRDGAIVMIGIVPLTANSDPMVGPNAIRAASSRLSPSFCCVRACSVMDSTMRTRSRTGTPSSSRPRSTPWTSPRVRLAAAISSSTTGLELFRASSSSLVSCRDTIVPACSRTTSARCVVTTAERSTTVTPATTAWWLSSAGIHLARPPNAGSRGLDPAQLLEVLAHREELPPGCLAAGTSTPWTRMA